MAGVYVYNKELLEEKPTLLYAGNIRHSQKTCKYHKHPKRKRIKTHLKISSNTAHIAFNPLSPNIHIQILQTDLHTFPS